MVAGLTAWMAAALGTRVALRDASRTFGQARVWSVERDGATLAWVKRYGDVGAAAREAQAYERWASAVGWGFAPFLGRCPTDPAALATRHVALPPADRGRRLEHLGRLGDLLAALHAVPLSEVDLVPLGDALVRRAEGWIRRGDVEPALAARVVGAVAAAAWRGAARVPCHRDVQLHNLLVGDDVVLLDLGQARPDLGLVDLVKLVELPDVLTGAERALLLARAGVEGEALDALERLRVLHGLGTWVWGLRHGDVASATRGRLILDDALRAVGAGGS